MSRGIPSAQVTYHTCGRKVKYASKTEARAGGPQKARCYRCFFCGSWHRATRRPEEGGKS